MQRFQEECEFSDNWVLSGAGCIAGSAWFPEKNMWHHLPIS